MSTATAPADAHETLDTSSLSVGGESQSQEPGNYGSTVMGTPDAKSVGTYDYSDDDPQYADPDDSPDPVVVDDDPPPATAAKPAKATATDTTATNDEPVKTSTTTEKSTKKTAPAADDPFTADIIAEASNYGISAEDARAFGSVAALNRAFAALDRQAAAAARGKTADTTTTVKQPDATAAAPAAQSTQPAQASAAPPAAQPATAQAPAATSDAAAGKGPFEKFKVDLNPEQFDEETISFVNKLNDHYDNVVRQQHAELQSLKSELSNLTGIATDFRNQKQAQFTEQMDSVFAGLDDVFADELGKGALHTLTADSPQLKNRVNLVSEMLALEQADAFRGRKPGTVQTLAQRALRSLYPDKHEQITKKQILSKVEERRSQAVHRPSGRKGKPSSPEQAATDFVNTFYRERGLDQEEAFDDEI